MFGNRVVAEGDFGALLRRLRIAARLTQEDIAAGAGLSVRSLRDIERGAVRYPRPDSVHRLAVALGLDGAQRAQFERLARAGYWADRARRQLPAAEGRRADADAGVRPAQLPPVISDFVDRLDHLKALDAMLATNRAETVTVVVVTGGGGTGKTALAVRWAHSIVHRFPAGHLHVDLRGFSADPPISPGKALRSLLSALGTPAERMPTDLAEAAGLYRSLVANRPVLVLLDNAASADQVVPLLPGSPGSIVVVTSRNPLDGLVIRHGAGRLAVGELRPDEAMTLLGSVIGAERVAAEPAAAARLVASCGYLALAVRIGAARLLGRARESIAQYVADLLAGNPLDALECDDAAIRHTFLHSYRRLDPDTALVFRRAGLVHGPSFTAAAAMAVSGLSGRAVTAALERLTAGHLLEPVEGDRFRFHDLLGRYARERCDAEETAPARAAADAALLGWYVAHLRAASSLLFPEKPQLPELSSARWPDASFAGRREALEWLDAEAASLVAAVGRYAAHGPREGVWLLACTLRPYFDLRGGTGDWLRSARLAVDAAEADGDPHARAGAESSLSHVLLVTGRRSDAMTHAKRSLAAIREAGWDDAEWLACTLLGSLSLHSGATGTASEYLDRALKICRRTGNGSGEANILANLCQVDIRLGNLTRAERRLRQALRLHRRVAVPSGEGHALVGLAELLWAFDRDAAAHRYALRALAVYRAIGHVVGEGYALATAAATCPDGAPLDPAIRQATDAVDLIRRTGTRLYEIHALTRLAALHLRAGDHRAASAGYARALTLARKIDHPYHQATILVGLARATGGHRGSARLAEAARIAADCGFRVVAADVETVRAQALLAEGQLAAGAAAARTAVELHRATGNTRGERGAHDLLARIGCSDRPAASVGDV